MNMNTAQKESSILERGTLDPTVQCDKRDHGIHPLLLPLSISKMVSIHYAFTYICVKFCI